MTRDGEHPTQWPHDAAHHAWWVEAPTVGAGGILAGEYPGDTEPTRSLERIELLVGHGVRTFVDLTTPDDGLPEYASHLAEIGHRRGLDLRSVRHPIPDFGVVSHDAYDAIAATIAEARTRGDVYVHCWGGIGRTGTVVGCLLIDGGLDADAALARLADLRRGTSKADRAAPEGEVQLALLRERALRRR